KDITTVQGLWEEWYTTGSPSTNNKPVVELNRLHGSKWRSSQKERAFYSRRLAIINGISKRQEKDSVTTEGAIKLCSEQKYSLGFFRVFHGANRCTNEPFKLFIYGTLEMYSERSNPWTVIYSLTLSYCKAKRCKVSVHLN
ncbi:transcriptional activator of glycolytic enzymes-domain-containing protein, partial [Pilaira anomala]